MLSSLSWGDKHLQAFQSLQEQLRNSVRLAHRDPNKVLCIYTDASELFWAVVVTQCNEEELKKPTMDQRHEPMAFHSSAFKGSQLGWTTYEKEGYAIYQTFKRMDWMLITEEKTNVFTDHRNLLFVFNPATLEPTLGHHVVAKVQRWAMYLSQFQYGKEHVDGSSNLMADIMTRWYRGYRGKTIGIKRLMHKLLAADIVSSPLTKEFDWPTAEQIRRHQGKHYRFRPTGTKRNEDALLCVAERIWIPDNDDDL